MHRVKSNKDEVEEGAKQNASRKAICEREEFAESLNINAADSNYAVAKYFAKFHKSKKPHQTLYFLTFSKRFTICVQL